MENEKDKFQRNVLETKTEINNRVSLSLMRITLE